MEMSFKSLALLEQGRSDHRTHYSLATITLEEWKSNTISVLKAAFYGWEKRFQATHQILYFMLADEKSWKIKLLDFDTKTKIKFLRHWMGFIWFLY